MSGLSFCASKGATDGRLFGAESLKFRRLAPLGASFHHSLSVTDPVGAFVGLAPFAPLNEDCDPPTIGRYPASVQSAFRS